MKRYIAGALVGMAGGLVITVVANALSGAAITDGKTLTSGAGKAMLSGALGGAVAVPIAKAAGLKA